MLTFYGKAIRIWVGLLTLLLGITRNTIGIESLVFIKRLEVWGMETILNALVGYLYRLF